MYIINTTSAALSRQVLKNLTVNQKFGGQRVISCAGGIAHLHFFDLDREKNIDRMRVNDIHISIYHTLPEI